MHSLVSTSKHQFSSFSGRSVVLPLIGLSLDLQVESDARTIFLTVCTALFALYSLLYSLLYPLDVF